MTPEARGVPCFLPLGTQKVFHSPWWVSSKPGKVWVYSTRARKLLWQTKQGSGRGAAALHGSSLLTHTTLHSNAGTAALGGKKSQQVLISYNLEMSINVSMKFWEFNNNHDRSQPRTSVFSCSQWRMEVRAHNQMKKRGRKGLNPKLLLKK